MPCIGDEFLSSSMTNHPIVLGLEEDYGFSLTLPNIFAASQNVDVLKMESKKGTMGRHKVLSR